MNIGKKIRQLRESMGWTQENLGEKIGVKRQQIQAYETGKNFPPFDKQVKLCEIFKVDMNTLSGYSEKASLTIVREDSPKYGSLEIEKLQNKINELQQERDELADKLEERNDELLTVYREKAELERELKKKSG